MTLIFFIFSLVGLSILFSWKIFEAETGRVLVSKQNLDKSDIFIEGVLIRLFTVYFLGLKKIFKLGLFGRKTGKIILVDLVKLKKIVLRKFFRLIKIDEEMLVNRDKGSVSLFLRTMTEAKEKDRKDK